MTRSRKQQAYVARKHRKAAKASKTPQGAFKQSHRRGAGQKHLEAARPLKQAILTTPSPVLLLLDRRQKPREPQGKVIPYPVNHFTRRDKKVMEASA